MVKSSYRKYSFTIAENEVITGYRSTGPVGVWPSTHKYF